MKKIITIFFAVIAFILPMKAGDETPTSIPITVEEPGKDATPTLKPLRAPMRVGVEAWYDSNLGTISISYSGEANGEVNLYCDGVLVDNSSEINTTFMVADHGLYTIEILTDSWTATGSISL